jgi:hypothetical protein
MENTLLKSKSYGWLKRKVKNRTNKIYMGQKVAPVYKVWQIDSLWFARQVATANR